MKHKAHVKLYCRLEKHYKSQRSLHINRNSSSLDEGGQTVPWKQIQNKKIQSRKNIGPRCKFWKKSSEIRWSILTLKKEHKKMFWSQGRAYHYSKPYYFYKERNSPNKVIDTLCIRHLKGSPGSPGLARNRKRWVTPLILFGLLPNLQVTKHFLAFTYQYSAPTVDLDQNTGGWV